MRNLGWARSGLALLVAAALPAQATAQVAWTDWTAASVGTAGSAVGTLTIGLTPITVRYTGEVYGQTQTSGGGTDYWAPGNAYSATGRPTGTDIITLTGGKQITQTLTFDAPIANPVMAILSLGQPGLRRYYDFDAPYTIMSSGAGFWGGDPSGSLFTTSVANELAGDEGHGVIQFNGTYTSISWTVPVEETWHGFTIGAATTVTPEPASMTLLATGLIGVVGAARRKRSGRLS